VKENSTRRPALRRHPGMRRAESAIWDRFCAEVRLPAGVLSYNVRVGTPAPGGPGESVAIARLRESASRVRVDALLHARDAVWLFEVKMRAGLSAVGQVIGYAHLISQGLSDSAPVLSVIICEHITPDITSVCLSEGIGLYTVAADGVSRWTPPALVEMFPQLLPR